MGKFAAIASGAKERRKDVKFTTLSGAEACCDLRVLTGTEYEACLIAATTAAKAANAEPVEGAHVFDFARACEAIRLAAVDSEDRATDVPYFASLQELKDGLDSERILFLFEIQNALQDEVSPRLGHMSMDEAIQYTWQHAIVPEGQELPFERWQPGLRRSFVHFLVAQVVRLADTKSPSSSAAGTSSITSTVTSQDS